MSLCSIGLRHKARVARRVCYIRDVCCIVPLLHGFAAGLGRIPAKGFHTVGASRRSARRFRIGAGGTSGDRTARSVPITPFKPTEMALGVARRGASLTSGSSLGSLREVGCRGGEFERSGSCQDLRSAGPLWRLVPRSCGRRIDLSQNRRRLAWSATRRCRCPIRAPRRPDRLLWLDGVSSR